MEKKELEKERKALGLKEEEEEPGKSAKKASTPVRLLRDTKKVDYTKYFSDEQDNSEEYVLSSDEKKELISKKRQRPKSVIKTSSNANTTKKPKEEKEQENKMNVEEEIEDKKNKGSNNYGTIINIHETLSKYSTETTDNNNVNNINIPNSDLILIILEVCLNASQFGIDKDNSSKLFWEEVGKIDLLKPITSKFKPETLRKYWRRVREAKKYKRIIQEVKRYKNELDNNNLKLLTGIKILCEYVSSPSKRKFEYFLNKHIAKPPSKNKKINANDMTPTEQIAEIINTFMIHFPKRKEKEIVEALLATSFDIENAYLLLKDKENLGFLAFSEKDDEVVKRNYEDKDDKNEEYQELINIKGLEDVLRRKEFLYDIKIDRTPYYKVEEEVPKETETKKEEDVKDENIEKDDIIEEKNDKQGGEDKKE